MWNEVSDGEDGPAATIHGLYAQLVLPSPQRDPSLGVILGGKNVTEVWAGSTLVTNAPAKLAYVPGSAKFTTNAGVFPLDDSLGSGARVLLGYERADGEYPVGYDSKGKYRGNGYMSFEVRVTESG